MGYRFQFLVVRLKAQSKITSSIICIFQFLMVRLKEGKNTRRNRTKRISIPYGSIKSIMCFHYLFFFHISIPYGSIKRLKNLSVAVTKYRISIPYGSIKSDTRQSNARIQRISIPYGSIKSNFMNNDDVSYIIFQFLMVRLKEFWKWRTDASWKFQFLMVRLKDW